MQQVGFILKKTRKQGKISKIFKNKIYKRNQRMFLSEHILCKKVKNSVGRNLQNVVHVYFKDILYYRPFTEL